jgi:L-lactate dehydrogenase complex protein LldG
MSDPRARILARLRASPGSVPTAGPAPIAIRRFDWTPEECLSRFRERLEAVRGEVHLVGDDWPAYLCDLLRRRGARNLLIPDGPLTVSGVDPVVELVAAWPEPEALPLIPYHDPIDGWRDRLFADIDAGLTTCRGAIAETGTLVLWPTPREPRLLSLVPPIHVCLLDFGAIWSTFAELMDAQGWVAGMPTNAVLITGPSKSADIEQTLAYGVHGPKELIVLVRESLGTKAETATAGC